MSTDPVCSRDFEISSTWIFMLHTGSIEDQVAVLALCSSMVDMQRSFSPSMKGLVYSWKS